MEWSADEYRKAFECIEHHRPLLSQLERSFLIGVCIDFNASRKDISLREIDALYALVSLYQEVA